METKSHLSIDGVFQEQMSHNQKNLRIFKTDSENFTRVVASLVSQNYRLAWLFGTDDRAEHKTFGVHAVLAMGGKNEWLQISAALSEANPEYPALTKTIMAAIWYEKYLMDMFGIVAKGHPDPRRLVHHENVPRDIHPLRKDFEWNTVMEKDDVPYPMLHVGGNGIYEIPVGPIHAGIIEPGHFRFNVAGERIVNLEGKLFFTHKGVEKLLEGKSVFAALPYVERISDDSAASHVLTFVQTLELIAGVHISERASLLRTLIAELERLTMHIHDISNIAGMGTGYTIMAAHGFRIKENLVRLSEKIFGNRFWRGFIIPGGVVRDLSEAELDLISQTVQEIMADMHGLLNIGLKSDGLLERMITAGVLTLDAAKAYGAVGIAVRAIDQKMDTRIDHPYVSYDRLKFQVVTKTGGDVFARFMVRVGELDVSSQMIEELCTLLRTVKGETKVVLVLHSGEALSAVEGFRGEILHFVRLNDKGFIERMAVRDPSFCNWPLFGEIGPGNIVPDFPLCNKSLNLSYSGNDL
ncbi:NADH-quinone oxidoreductase subunit C [Candidatus Peregrinibacteria bacterium]|nr:NADH-quinone oxidoreductase subunit C [Candidatus Peregrinibacteria bacterium]